MQIHSGILILGLYSTNRYEVPSLAYIQCLLYLMSSRLHALATGLQSVWRWVRCIARSDALRRPVPKWSRIMKCLLRSTVFKQKPPTSHILYFTSLHTHLASGSDPFWIIERCCYDSTITRYFQSTILPANEALISQTECLKGERKH